MDWNVILSTLHVESRSTLRNVDITEAEILEILPDKDRSEMGASAQTRIREYAAFEWPTLNHKGRMAKLARELDWRHRRVRAVYQNEDGVSLRASEMADIEALKEAQHEYRDLAQLANSLHALLYGPEADFYRPQVDAIRAALLPQGGSPATSGGDPGTGNQGREG